MQSNDRLGLSDMYMSCYEFKKEHSRWLETLLDFIFLLHAFPLVLGCAALIVLPFQHYTNPAMSWTEIGVGMTAAAVVILAARFSLLFLANRYAKFQYHAPFWRR